MTPGVKRHHLTEVTLDAVAVLLLLVIVVAGAYTYVSESQTRNQQTVIITNKLEELAAENAGRLDNIEATLLNGGCEIESTVQ